MRKIEFTNKLYLGFVILITLYHLFINTWALIQTGRLVALLPMTIQSTFLALVLLRHEWVKYGIKGFSLFFLIPSGLQILSQLIFLSSAPDKVDYNLILKSLILILIGLALFGFCDRSIRRTDDKTTDDTRTVDA
jgi:hypothetical protein